MPYKDKYKFRDYQNEYRSSHRGDGTNALAVHKYHRSIKGQYTSLRRRAKERGHEMTVSFEEFKNLRRGVCHYCLRSLNETGSGLDRVDHEKGYVQGNVVPCCGQCNVAKGYLEGAGFSVLRVLQLLKEVISIRHDSNSISEPRNA